MLNVLGSSQRDLLQVLQRNKEGRTVEEIARDIELSPAAVRQHLTALENRGYVRRLEPRKTAGRPGFVFALSASGNELFPRKYSWFTGLILASLMREQGPEGLGEYLRGMARAMAESLRAELVNQPPELRLTTLAATMNQLGYDAELVPGEAEIRAYNCIYHHLAQDYPQVCEFDLELMAQVSGRRVEHVECMVRGGQCCRFRLKGAPDSTPPRIAP
jgi:DeoR family transcriptional regulator, suf operon transcriptional repressor